MDGPGRCDSGISSGAWASGEGQKGISCQTEDNAVRVDISCVVSGGVSGWQSQGSRHVATGNCTAKALYGASTHVQCFIPGCHFTVGKAGAHCSNITCFQDLSAPDARPDDAAAGFAAGLTGALDVECFAQDLDRQTVRCWVNIGALSIPADCTVSRCIIASAPPTLPYDPNVPIGPRDIPAECAALLAERFNGLAISVAGIAIGLILLIVGACSGGLHQPPAARKMIKIRETRPECAARSDQMGAHRNSARPGPLIFRVPSAPRSGSTTSTKEVSVEMVRGSTTGSPSSATGTPSSGTQTSFNAAADLGDVADELSTMVQQISPLHTPAKLEWSALSVTARGGACSSGPQVVQTTTGRLCNGCTALMGPSGSGKTTLLHAVTGLPHAGMKRRGLVTLDGVDVHKLPHGVLSLVSQDAVLPEELSAREALVFASALGLRRVSKAERLALVEAILNRLGIASVAHLPIGGRLAGRSGLSGGERKRVSVGVSVATCPQALLLDEPSSGLDAYSAFELVRLLKTLAWRANRTVLVSVHQPSSQLFELFDGLILLAKGMRLYHGPPLSAVDHLLSLGAPEPEMGVAPADHLLHVLVTHEETFRSDPVPHRKKRSPSREGKLFTSALAKSDGNSPKNRPGMSTDASAESDFDNMDHQHPLYQRDVASSGGQPRRQPTSEACYATLCNIAFAPCSAATEARWLGWRCVAQLARDPSLVNTQLAVHLLVALFMGGIFFQVESDIAGFQNKAGSISFLLYFFALAGLSTSQTVTREWPLLWAEYHQGLYGAITYTVTRLVLELTLLRVLPSLAFSGIFYAMMGLKREIVPFVRFLLAAALASADSALLCTAIAACFPRQPGAASLIATVALLFCILVAGFNLNLTALPEWIEWLAWISFGRHAFEIMLCGELEDQMVDIDVPGAPPVRIRASIILGAMGLDPERYSSAFASLLLIGAVLLVTTASIVFLQMRPTCRRGASRTFSGSLSKSERGANISPTRGTAGEPRSNPSPPLQPPALDVGESPIRGIDTRSAISISSIPIEM